MNASLPHRNQGVTPSNLPDSGAPRAWPSRDILRTTLIVAGVALALQLLWVARSVFVLAFLGVLFGLTLSAGVTRLNRRGLPRPLGALILVLAVIALVVGAGYLLAPRIADQAGQLQQELPAALSSAEQWLDERQGWVTRLLQLIAGGRPGPEPSSLRETLAQQIGSIGSNFFSIFSSTIALLGSLIVVTFVAVYIAVDPGIYRRGVMHLVPHRVRPKAAEIMDAMAVTLQRWLVAQMIGMLVIGTITTLVLLLLGVRAAVALGVIAGLLEFIPYFGPILSAVPGLAMAFLDGPQLALWVLVAYIAIQQVEGNLLTPFLMKEGLGLPPVVTIVGQAVMSMVFGFVGLIIAMPLLGTIMVPIKLLYVQDVVGDEVAVPGT